MPDRPRLKMTRTNDPQRLQATVQGTTVVVEWAKFWINQFVPQDTRAYAGQFVDDNVGQYVAEVQLSQPAPSGASITLTASGSAVDPDNYSLPQGTTIAIPEGDTSFSVLIDVVDAGKWFADRMLVLEITGTAGGLVIGAESKFFLVLRASTPFPSVWFDVETTNASYTTSPISAQVNLSAEALDPITVYFDDFGGGSADPADYSLPNSITIAAGTLSEDVDLTWTGGDPGGTDTVEATIRNSRGTEVNRYTFSEQMRTERNQYDQGGLDANVFPGGLASDNSEGADQVYGCINTLKAWSLSDELDATVQVPDGSGDKATIAFPSAQATGSGCARKSYESYRADGFDHRNPLGPRQTLSLYVHRPSDTARISKRFSVKLDERAPIKQAFGLFLEWPAGGTGKPTVVLTENLTTEKLVSWSYGVWDETDDPLDPALLWSSQNAHEWYRVWLTIDPLPAEYGGTTNKFLRPWQSTAGQGLVNAKTRKIGTCFWGVQHEYGDLTAYSPRPGMWWWPKGGAAGVAPLVHTWEVTT